MDMFSKKDIKDIEAKYPEHFNESTQFPVKDPAVALQNEAKAGAEQRPTPPRPN